MSHILSFFALSLSINPRVEKCRDVELLIWKSLGSLKNERHWPTHVQSQFVVRCLVLFLMYEYLLLAENTVLACTL